VRLLVFPKLKTAFRGHRFSDIPDIQGHATIILQSIPEEEFQKCLSCANIDSLCVLVRKETTSKVATTISV
jgi:hypothetical protein